MTLAFDTDNAALYHGDCLEVLKGIESDLLDSCVTDPPYGLSFMGKEWDHGVPGEVFWREVYRVLKPGAHLLAFGGSRTYHWLACAIESAGFEIRDQIMWLYGSGFPKSMDISKAIDKAAGEKQTTAYVPNHENKVFGRGMGGGDWNAPKGDPITAAAAAWQGWGTALKPAHEPIVVARKPLSEKTVAANVLTHGTGGLNIDGCRIEGTPWTAHEATGLAKDKFFTRGEAAVIQKSPHDGGRFPANIIHDGSDEVIETFPDGGAPARFFYCAKAPKKERRGSKHPTVKPLALMRYLCRLVTPTGGGVLDPFAGSGTTGEAAILEGFGAMLIEQCADYIPDIITRLTAEIKEEAA